MTSAGRSDGGRVVRCGDGRRIRSALPSREAALASAELFRTLALAFSYPEDGLIETTRRQIGISQVASSDGRLPLHLRGMLKTAARHWRAATIDDLRVEHSRLFLGAALVSLREGGYGDGKRFAGQPVDLADLNGFYLAFGFGPPVSEASPPDHLGVELEFISLLYLKIAYALQQRQIDQARITRAALARFLEDHFGRWVRGFEAGLAEAGAAPAYLSLAGILTRAVATECDRLGIYPIPADSGTISDPVGLDELVCPLAEPVRQREAENQAEIS